jgi:hypothetical protein
MGRLEQNQPKCPFPPQFALLGLNPILFPLLCFHVIIYFLLSQNAHQIKSSMMHMLFMCYWLLNPPFDGVYSHVILSRDGTHI